MRETDKVDETIEALCDWIQKQLVDGKCDASHQVSDMVKALAELVSASANKRMSERVSMGSNSIHRSQK